MTKYNIYYQNEIFGYETTKGQFKEMFAINGWKELVKEWEEHRERFSDASVVYRKYDTWFCDGKGRVISRKQDDNNIQLIVRVVEYN